MEKPTVEEIGRVLAESHVDWFLSAIRPLLIAQFEHGFKHGLEIDKKDQLSQINMKC